MKAGIIAIIEDLLHRAIDSRNATKDLAAKCQRNCLVDPGFPILWFGNLDAYLDKPKEQRALTIGVNPSGQELRRNRLGSYIHFPDINTESDSIEVKDYIKALNGYFLIKPLKWFEKGMEIVPFKYGDGSLIHIDCCSTIATKPTWTGLCDYMREHLKRENEIIFEKLLCNLMPSKIYIASNTMEKEYIEKRCREILNLGDTPILFIHKY